MSKNIPLQHSIQIRKEALKFSSAHMTVFPDGTKERLHGHGYQTELLAGLAGTSLKQMVSFSVFKAALAGICKSWDEKVLLAENSPFFEVKRHTAQEIEFVLCACRYVLPADDVELLPIENITCEDLATEALRRVLEQLKKTAEFSYLLWLELRVNESPGQGASCRWEAPK